MRTLRHLAAALAMSGLVLAAGSAPAGAAADVSSEREPQLPGLPRSHRLLRRQWRLLPLA